jgi:hypothetical protein
MDKSFADDLTHDIGSGGRTRTPAPAIRPPPDSPPESRSRRDSGHSASGEAHGAGLRAGRRGRGGVTAAHRGFRLRKSATSARYRTGGGSTGRSFAVASSRQPHEIVMERTMEAVFRVGLWCFIFIFLSTTLTVKGYVPLSLLSGLPDMIPLAFRWRP